MLEWEIIDRIRNGLIELYPRTHTRTHPHTHPHTRPHPQLALSPSVTIAVPPRVACQRTDDHQHREDHSDDDHADEHVEAADVLPCDRRAGPRTKVVEVLPQHTRTLS